MPDAMQLQNALAVLALVRPLVFLLAASLALIALAGGLALLLRRNTE